VSIAFVPEQIARCSIIPSASRARWSRIWLLTGANQYFSYLLARKAFDIVEDERRSQGSWR
jgi:hypothetical protein